MTTTAAQPSTAAAEFEQRGRSPLQRVQLLLHRRPEISPLVVLVLAVLVFGLINDRFWQPANLSLVLQQVAIVAALAVGQTLIILTAGIDLSIGAVAVLVSLVMSKLVYTNHQSAFVALLVGLVVALAAAALNGLLVTRIKLPPFIVTLGTLSVFTAISLIYAKGQTVTLSPTAMVSALRVGAL